MQLILGGVPAKPSLVPRPGPFNRPGNEVTLNHDLVACIHTLEHGNETRQEWGVRPADSLTHTAFFPTYSTHSKI